jgi:voltage-gated potassium channel
LDRQFFVSRALIAIACVLTIGTLGYHFIEGWTVLEGFYMTVITISTIGFKEVHDLSAHGQLFTLFIIFCGIGVMGYAIVAGTSMIVEGELNRIFSRRRSMKAISRLQDHFIICGYGRMGSFICEQLALRQIPFVVIEHRPEVQDRVMQAGYFLSPGDATEEDVLVTAGIKTARGLVSVLDSDASNVYVVLSARELNPGIDIVARAGDESAGKKLQRAGASRVISPYRIGGMRMVMGILKPEVMNFIELAMDHSQLDIELEQIQVGPDSLYSGKRLIETDIRKELNLIIVAVRKADGNMVFNPGPNTVLNDHDVLIAIGERKNLERLELKSKQSNSTMTL